ncbi:epimerase [Bacillus sp. AFS076308]|uniref:NAD-dependent epimerase/dehydratase family protein n=1 Tax=unclassified Bacillus (in: firmicutes) TaxID=185979 RepID=UPI000BF4B7E9|nr:MULTISPECIES: NAD-dependent epimerase/dehydratase family protein [unclassified Bacillus (in: firmicutes)]PFN96775.1 epimerase [Bacillus sp. AFS076308]PGV52166.1 epimerase [Bacillus sp. AFS037270]
MEPDKKNKIYQTDLQYIYQNLSDIERDKLRNSSILVTGCGGFLGYYLMSFLAEYSDKLNIKKIIGIDNFKLGKPKWLIELSKLSNKIELYPVDITQFSLFDHEKINDVDFVIHMASIASPTFYRKYPLETIDANVLGLRALLEFYKNKEIKGVLFFSSSEVYGDPDPSYIPTPEDYRGNVSMIGPRACYDESKRFGETLCYLYAEKFQMPISIVRPFNSFGPGMRLNDKRVPADFAKAVVENKKLVMYSDGNPTRTFCYVADAIVGYLKALLYEPFDYFNIGMDTPEISIKELAEIYKEAGSIIYNFNQSIEFRESEESSYLTHNPSRRCPDISKAKKLLGYAPSISVVEGVHRFLSFLKEGGEIH